MDIKFTQNISYKLKEQPLSPKKETLQLILAFAATYKVEKLKNGEIISYFTN